MTRVRSSDRRIRSDPLKSPRQDGQGRTRGRSRQAPLRAREPGRARGFMPRASNSFSGAACTLASPGPRHDARRGAAPAHRRIPDHQMGCEVQAGHRGRALARRALTVPPPIADELAYREARLRIIVRDRPGEAVAVTAGSRPSLERPQEVRERSCGPVILTEPDPPAACPPRRSCRSTDGTVLRHKRNQMNTSTTLMSHLPARRPERRSLPPCRLSGHESAERGLGGPRCIEPPQQTLRGREGLPVT